MRKLVFLLVVFVASTASAQEIERPSSTGYYTFSKNPDRVNFSYWDYTGQSTDLLVPTTSDTIDIRFHVKKHRPYTAKVMSKFDPVTTKDTTVAIALLGRNSTDESWTAITDVITDTGVRTDGTVKTLSSSTAPTYTATIAAYTALVDTTDLAGYPADSIQIPQQTLSLAETSTFLEYRYLLVRYIISGDLGGTETGIELKRCELKLYEH